jgi:hypothetical protein
VPKSFQQKKTRVFKTTTLSEVIATKLRAGSELDLGNDDKPRRKLKPQSSELKDKIGSHVVATNCDGTVGGRVVHQLDESKVKVSVEVISAGFAGVTTCGLGTNNSALNVQFPENVQIGKGARRRRRRARKRRTGESEKALKLSEKINPGLIQRVVAHEKVLEAKRITTLRRVKSRVVGSGGITVGPKLLSPFILISRSLSAITEDVGGQFVHDLTAKILDHWTKKKDDGVMAGGKGLSSLARHAKNFKFALDLRLNEVIGESQLPIRVRALNVVKKNLSGLLGEF